jgi:chromosome segregation ATPase
VYDPANWSKADDGVGLTREVSALEELQRKLVPVDRPASIRESGLAKRLEDTRSLAALHQRLRPRGEQIRSRLSELRQSDRDTRDDLERLSSTMEQIALLLNGNTFLQEIATVELSKLRGEAARLREDLERPEVGLLDKKVARLKTLVEGLTRSASAWLERLSANMQIHTAVISEALAGLDAVAQLEDREVSDARELLRRVGAVPGYARPSSFMEAAATLKRCASDWQAAAACAAALEQFTTPVLSAARDAEQARRSLKTVMQSASKLISARREWPPTRSALENDAAEFQKLETRLDGLRGQRWSASRLVREMGLIYHEMDKLDDRAAQALRSAEGERSAIQEAERSLGDLTRRLESFAQRYPDDPAVGDGARDLLTQAEQRIAYLRAQYRRGGIDYDQALAGLEELADSLRAARFTTSEGRSVGIEN